MNLKQTAKRLKQDIPTVYLALKDPQTPFVAKMMGILTVGYALSPVDLIPDFVPILGYLDDVILLPVMVALTVKLIPKEVWDRNRDLAKDLWKDGKPKKWYYAVPIVIFWLLIIYIIIKKWIEI